MFRILATVIPLCREVNTALPSFGSRALHQCSMATPERMSAPLRYLGSKSKALTCVKPATTTILILLVTAPAAYEGYAPKAEATGSR